MTTWNNEAVVMLIQKIESAENNEAIVKLLDFYYSKFQNTENETLINILTRVTRKELILNDKIVFKILQNFISLKELLKELENYYCQEKYKINFFSRNELYELMANDRNNSSIISDIYETFKVQLESITVIREQLKNLSKQDITCWAIQITKKERGYVDNNIESIIAHLCHGVYLDREYYPRDVQLLAVLIFANAMKKKKGRLGQIATGEGKTLITAMLAIFRGLANEDVNVITSSPVLAEENLRNIGGLYQLFNISVHNNCDKLCEEDEEERKRRYQNRVIYGDLSSFQGDILMTNFFEKGITSNRTVDCIIVDEVDSMLLDKGENMLYLSHDIQELKSLRHVFLEIWQAIHGKDVRNGSESDVALVVKLIRLRIRNGEIKFSTTLKTFVENRLTTWVNNAYLAEKLALNDPYILSNAEKKGYKVVIMDKDTGVEQMNTEWGSGLQQFVQLKHLNKLSPENLKSVFMSNLSYFKQFKRNIYGITGTLGAESECSLLGQCYGVDLFSIPRYKSRHCIMEEEKIGSTEDAWLELIVETVSEKVKCSRAILIICENVKNVNKISSAICKTQPKEKVYSYLSSFDEIFHKRNKAHPLDGGDIIVGTNLAGRGTDLITTDNLEKNGGLHVILSFMSGNRRVEEQAFGRTARAGLSGSTQFILLSPIQNPSVVRLQKIRDIDENDRLENFRLKSLQIIEMEELLFGKFEKLYGVVKDILLKSSLSKDIDKLQQQFLNNRWVLWLDSMTENISRVHIVGEKSILTEFEKFDQEILTCTNEQNVFKLAALATDYFKLGRMYEHLKNYPVAIECFDQAIEKDPDFSEMCHYYKAACTLKNSGHFKSKRKALDELKSAGILIKRQINENINCQQTLAYLSDLRRSAGEGSTENHFERQISNECRILQTHIGSIEQSVGQSLSIDYINSFPQVMDRDEAQEIFENIKTDEMFVKNYRVSKKVKFYGENGLDIGLNKKIEWPPTMLIVKDSIVGILKTKASNDNFIKRIVDTDCFSSVVLTKKKFWDILKDSNIIVEDISCKELRFVNGADEKLRKFVCPESIIDFKSVILKIIPDNHKNEYSSKIWDVLEIPDGEISILEKALEESGNLESIKTRRGKLCDLTLVWRDNEKKWDGIPKSMESYRDLFEAFIEEEKSSANETPKLKENLIEDDIPLLKDSDSASKEIWLFLKSQDVIKDCKVLFPFMLSQNQELIDRQVEVIKRRLKSNTKLQEIFTKYHSGNGSKLEDFEILLENLNKLLIGLKNPECNVNDFVENIKTIREVSRSVFDECPTGINEDDFYKEKHSLQNLQNPKQEYLYNSKMFVEKLKNDHKSKKYEEYLNGIQNGLLNSVGQLKTFPEVKASYKDIDKYFTQGEYSPEIGEYQDAMHGNILFLEEKKPFNWGPFIVALIGIAQIAFGIFLECVSVGFLTFVATGLISEGMGDIMFAVEAGLSGNFSWANYRSHKKLSLLLTVCSVGIGAYLARGAQVAKFGAKAGFQLFKAAGSNLLKKCCTAATFALTNYAIEKLLTYIRQKMVEIFKNCFKYLFMKSTSAIPRWIPSFEAPTETTASVNNEKENLKKNIDKLYDVSYENGQAEKIIERVYKSVMEDVQKGGLGTKITGVGISAASNIAGGMVEAHGKTFSDGQSLAEKSECKFDHLGMGGNKIQKSFSIIRKAQKILKAVKWIKIGTSLFALANFYPEIVHKMNKELEREIRSLGRNYESRDNKTKVKSDTKEFEKFVSQFINDSEDEILDALLAKVQSQFVQPHIQSMVNSAIQKVGKAGLAKTKSALKSVHIYCQQKPSTSPQEGNPTVLQNEINDETPVKNANNVTLGHIKKIYGNNVETYTDSTGNLLFKRPTFQKYIENIKSGKSGGLIEVLMLCNFIGKSIKIVRLNDFDEDSEDNDDISENSTKFHPNGKISSDKPAITIGYTTDDNGNGHFQPIYKAGGRYHVVDLSQNDETAGTCLLQSIQFCEHYENQTFDASMENPLSDDQMKSFRTNFADFSAKSKTAKYLYENRVGETAIHFHGGDTNFKGFASRHIIQGSKTREQLIAIMTQRKLDWKTKNTFVIAKEDDILLDFNTNVTEDRKYFGGQRGNEIWSQGKYDGYVLKRCGPSYDVFPFHKKHIVAGLNKNREPIHFSGHSTKQHGIFE